MSNFYDDEKLTSGNSYHGPGGGPVQDENGQWWTEDGIPMISNRDRYNTPGSGI